MTQNDSLGERVTKTLEEIESFYSLDRTTPLAEMIASRSYETTERLKSLRQRLSTGTIRLCLSIKGFNSDDAKCFEGRLQGIQISDANQADIIIMDPYAKDLDSLLSADALRILWTHDHHHTYGHYVLFLLKANVVIPAHFYRRDHLRAFSAHITDTVPATTNQWTNDEIVSFSSQKEIAPRSDALYGGFGAYDVSLERSLFVGKLMEMLPVHALSIRRIQSDDDPYFTLPVDLRYADWRRYKVSLAAAINQDIPIRIFDALASGQIPIIPKSLINLSWVISPEDQSGLGIECYEAGDPHSAIEAWRRAVTNFDRMGQQGVRDRITYFLSKHSLAQRLERIIKLVL